jgi:hypothetical protein
VVDAVEFEVGVRRWRLDGFVVAVVLLALGVLPLVEVPDGLRRVIVAFGQMCGGWCICVAFVRSIGRSCRTRTMAEDVDEEVEIPQASPKL